MFENKIVFKCLKELLELTDIKPEPISFSIPEWYKKLEHTFTNMTVKGCLPFMDTLTTGYLLRTQQDYYFNLKKRENPKKGESEWDYQVKPSLQTIGGHLAGQSEYTGVQTQPSWHGNIQLFGSQYIERNLADVFFKFDNPWFIETPPGYSCLFVPPLNNNDNRFEVLSGIVDTDMHMQRIQFPAVFNGWKYKQGYEGTVKKGTPLVQIIPFKRERWKMKIETLSKFDIDKRNFSMGSKRFKYIRGVWQKKITR